MNMINAMRAGQLPTQLVFSLSALHMHGYELVAVRYFKLDGDGEIVYLTEAEAVAAEKIRDIGARNRAFGNVEIKFKRPGKAKEQIFRHIAANLDNTHIKSYNPPLKHLEKKGKVAAMTKAASYLLSYGDFSTFRDYWSSTPSGCQRHHRVPVVRHAGGWEYRRSATGRLDHGGRQRRGPLDVAGRVSAAARQAALVSLAIRTATATAT